MVAKVSKETLIAGPMRFVFDDHEEVYKAGDAFYQPPGHRPYVDAGTELLQFSPTDKLDETERAIADRMSRQQGAPS
jgi:quercetin dioxygenase-like cupin family protein